MPGSPLERIKQLDQERAQLIAGAKREMLDRANSAIAELNALGFSYRIVDGGKPQPSRQQTRTVKDSECPICKLKTSPRHDARRHRSQKTKKPFTAAELKEMGLEKA